MATHTAFEAAYQKFITSLPDNERRLYSPCASANDLIESLGKLEALSDRRRKAQSTAIIASVKKLSDRLEPYFGVINSTIQADPQYAAFAWGALRFILVISSQYVSFFEKLVAMFERLALVLPAFGRIPLSIADSPHVQTILEKIYASVLDIFEVTARLFTNRHGSIRKSPAVVGSVLWTPFNVRYQESLDKIAFYKDLLLSEVSLADAKYSIDAEVNAARERKLAELERQLAKESRDRTEEIHTSSDASLALQRKLVDDSQTQMVLRWLQAPDSRSILHRSQSQKEEGTSEWIFQHSTFRQWHDQEWEIRTTSKQNVLGRNTLWLNGNPGAGKTMVASSIVEHLGYTATQVCESANSFAVLYFFFRAEDSSLQTDTAAWMSLCDQLVRQYRADSNIMDQILFCMPDSVEKHCHATGPECWDILRNSLRQLKRCFVIIDGVDECSNHRDLLKKLQILMAESQIKLCLISRPNVPGLQRERGRPPVLTMPRDCISRDIAIYAHNRILEMVEEDLLPEGTDSDALAEHFVRGADGMFIWAVLMAQFLRSPGLTPAQRLRLVREVVLPEGLEQMYDRILAHITSSSSPDRHVARQVLLWLAYAQTPLETRLLEQAVLFSQGEDPEDPVLRFPDFSGSAVVSCAGFVESVNWRDSPKSLRFVHSSVTEHFAAAPNVHSTLTTDVLVPSVQRPVELAILFLRVILRSAPGPTDTPKPKCGALNNRLVDFPLLKYSCWQWPTSLARMYEAKNSMKDDCSLSAVSVLMEDIEKFLSNPCAVSLWLEVLLTSTSGQDTRSDHERSADFWRVTCLRNITMWATWIRELPECKLETKASKCAERLLSFSDDIASFLEQWGGALDNDPTMIYADSMLLTNSKFLYRPSKENVHFLSTEASLVSTSSSVPFCTSSVTDTHGLHSVVLSIWTSRAFEEYWKTMDPRVSFSEIEQFCSGWKAQLAIWSVRGNPQCLAKLEIDLSHSEIALQMRQSLRANAGNDWKSSFPHTIHADSKTIIILRTVYRLTSDALPKWAEATLPLDFSPLLQKKWSDQLEAFDPSSERLAGVPAGLLFIHRDWYTYMTAFSHDGKYIFFADSHRGNMSYANHLAVFEVNLSSELVVSLCNSSLVLGGPGEQRRPPTQALFCPHNTLSFTFESSVWIWEYTSAKIPSKLRSDLEYITSLSLSICKDYLVVTTADGTVIIDWQRESQKAISASGQRDSLAISASADSIKTHGRSIDSQRDSTGRSKDPKLLNYMSGSGSSPDLRTSHSKIDEDTSGSLEKSLWLSANIARQDLAFEKERSEAARSRPKTIGQDAYEKNKKHDRHEDHENLESAVHRPCDASSSRPILTNAIVQGTAETTSVIVQRLDPETGVRQNWQLLPLPKTYMGIGVVTHNKNEEPDHFRLCLNQLPQLEYSFKCDLTNTSKTLVIDQSIENVIPAISYDSFTETARPEARNYAKAIKRARDMTESGSLKLVRAEKKLRMIGPRDETSWIYNQGVDFSAFYELYDYSRCRPPPQTCQPENEPRKQDDKHQLDP